jgi:hypothetical protein
MHFREEPGKQKLRSCRAQELARAGPRKMSGRKKDGLPSSARIAMRSRLGQTKPCELLVTQGHHGIDAHCPPRWQVSCGHRYSQ